MTLPDNTRNAGTKTVKDWTAIKVRPERCNNDPSIWNEAFRNFFKARLDSRYFKPVHAIERMGQNVGEGFAIVTLHCSLIEFLSSTLEGKTYRYRKKGDPALGCDEYTDSRDMFTRFLRTRVPFCSMFSNDVEADDFYKSVRCGHVHEARTKGLWKIKVCRSAAALAIDANAKVVYRNKMQAAFEQFVNWYEQTLPTDAELQQAFIRKFDSLCRG